MSLGDNFCGLKFGKAEWTLMDSITIPIVVGEDRHLVIQLPSEVPVGPAELVIRTREAPAGEVANPAREVARAKLQAAGLLGTAHVAPDNAQRASDEELQRLGTLPPGSPSIDDLINEDRGTY